MRTVATLCWRDLAAAELGKMALGLCSFLVASRVVLLLVCGSTQGQAYHLGSVSIWQEPH